MLYAVLLFPGKLHAEHAVLNTTSICPPWQIVFKKQKNSEQLDKSEQAGEW